MKNSINKQLFTLATFIVLSMGFSPSSAKAETTQCTQIATLPAVITVQGIYCFKANLVTAITTGNAIEIQTNNVTIDMNGFKLGGALAGAGTLANGFYADGRKNITIKNGNIRGFLRGIFLDGVSGSGHMIEIIRADGNTRVGFQVKGDNNIIRNNHVINTGGGTESSIAYGMNIISASNTLIADNVISGVSESVTAYGIILQSSSRFVVRGNSVFELKDATHKLGISFLSSSEITILDNRIINTSGTGTTGIIEGSPSNHIVCLDNVTIGYTTTSSGCDLVVNHQNL